MTVRVNPNLPNSFGIYPPLVDVGRQAMSTKSIKIPHISGGLEMDFNKVGSEMKQRQ